MQARPSLHVWQSTQKALHKVQQDLTHTRLELQCATAAAQARLAEGCDGVQLAAPVRSAGTLGQEDVGAMAMVADTEFYSLHLYKLKHTSADVLRQRLGAICRLLRSTPDAVVRSVRQRHRLAETVPELQRYAKEVAQQIRSLDGSQLPADEAAPPPTVCPALDWHVGEILDKMKQALDSARADNHRQKAALQAIAKTMRSVISNAPGSSFDLEHLPQTVAMCASSLLQLHHASEQWSEAEAAILAEVRKHIFLYIVENVSDCVFF